MHDYMRALHQRFYREPDFSELEDDIENTRQEVRDYLILGHTKASFTVDTYTHTTSDMHRKAAEIVGGFLTDYLGEEMAPWQSAENAETAAST